MNLQKRVYLRHAIAILLLALSWRYLSQWYFYRGKTDFIVASVLFCIGIAIAAWPSLLSLFKKTHTARLAVVLLLFSISLPWAEWLRQNPDTSREDWTRQIFFQAILLYACLGLFHLFPVIPTTIHRLFNKTLNFLASRKLLYFLPALIFFLLTSWISLFVYKKTPLVQDSAAHLFQAKVFSQLKLFAPAPPVLDFFSYVGDMLVIKDGKWFSMYTPGTSLLLALAMFLGAEWILSPLLGALSIAIWIAYTARWHGSRAAAILGILALFSPFLVIMSSTIMVHTPELFLASAAVYLCRAESEKPRLWQRLALVPILATAVLVRLFSIYAFITPILAFACWKRFQAKDWKLTLFAIFAIAAGGLLLALYQWQTTGDPFLSGYFLEYPDLKYGFGTSFGGRVHTPLRALENISNNFLGVNTWVTGWYSGSLFFIFGYFLLARKLDAWNKTLYIGCLGVIVFYFFYVLQGLIFGPRSYYVFAPVIILTVALLMDEAALEHFELKNVLALAVLALLSVIPVRFPYLIMKFYPTNFDAGELKKEIRHVGNTKSLVFLEDINPEFVDWNDPFFREPAILVRDLKSRNPEAMAKFSKYRPMYFRFNLAFEKENLQSGFKLYPTRENKPPGDIRLFELALAVDTEHYPDKDFFDICYRDFFDEKNAREQLEYLSTEGKKEREENEYKKNFRLTLMHLARLLLLPKVAYEESDTNWQKNLNLEDFRNELALTANYSARSGEVGKSISAELEKARRRIDQNKDGVLSDEEILYFLSEKIHILELK